MRWISVKDEMPEDHIKVVVHCLGHSNFGYYDGNEFRYWDSDNRFFKGDVTHWLKLPLLPKD